MPAPLRVAVAVAVAEGVALAAYGVVLLFALTFDRAVMGVSTAVFFTGYGAALVAGAVLLAGLRSWTRAPVVLAQLIQLGVAWSFRGGGTTTAAVLLAVAALAVLGGVLHPASLSALARSDELDERR